MSTLSSTTLQPILAHLMIWGELSSAEARHIKAEAGLPLLAEGGWVQSLPDAWLVGLALRRRLPAANLEVVWQRACCSLPAYQQYLTSLAAGEIARRGLEGARDLVEDWAAVRLPSKAGQFNTLLDAIELSDLGGPVGESTPGALLQAVKQRLQAIQHSAGLDFTVWNRELLGVSAPEEAVFQSALQRGALDDHDSAETQPLLTQTPIQELNNELAQPAGRWVFCPRLEHPNPFNHPLLSEDPAWRIRRYVYSSVPLLGENTAIATPTTKQVWQAAAQHPISWILIQLGLIEHIQINSGATVRLALEIEPKADGSLNDLRIEINGHPARRMSEVLPALVSALGMQLVLPFGQLEPGALGSWVEMLIQVGVFETYSNRIRLSPDFANSSFESHAVQQMIKAPKPWRARLIDVLEGE